MSMLAERKRKQKWSLNPRGNDWSKDTNKFGKKLMERMGWKEGKGLGLNEDGGVEHIHIAYKNDAKGIGFKESIEWSHQQDNFAALLNELNNGSGKDITSSTVKSLEEKSEKSRARVHYRKFTRGKDLSRYSEKDLANILGRRKLASELSVDNLENDSMSSSLSTSEPLKFGVNTTVGGSMVDYFKNKLPNLKSNNSNTTKSESESDINYGFGFNVNSLNTNDTIGNSVDSKKKRKSNIHDTGEMHGIKKDKGKDVGGVINPGFDPLSRSVIIKNDHILDTICETDESFEVVQEDKKYIYYKQDAVDIKDEIFVHDKLKNAFCKDSNKTKKRKEKCNEKVATLGVNNPCFNIDSFEASTETSDSVVQNAIIQVEKRKKKKGKGTLNIINNEYSDCTKVEMKIEECLDLCNQADAVVLKKPKHSKKRQMNSCETNIDDIQKQACFDNLGFTESEKIRKTLNVGKTFEAKPKIKSKQNKNLKNMTHNIDTENTDRFDIKIKKKRKTFEDGVDNPAFTDYSSIKILEENVDVPVHKRKKRRNLDEECYNIKEHTRIEETSVVDKVKKCKKIDNSEICSNVTGANEGFDNPALSLTDSLSVDDSDLILNITNEPIENKPPNVKKTNKNVRFNNINMEYLFEEIAASPEDIAQRNELCDINTKVIAESSARYKKLKGLDNAAFNLKSSVIEEGVNSLQKSLENCQAEVENGINESKVTKLTYEERMIGETNSVDAEDEPHPRGVIFRLKNANFAHRVPQWGRKNDISVSFPKKSYKHLIRGDIVLGFKDTNLHKITGYGNAFNKSTHVI